MPCNLTIILVVEENVIDHVAVEVANEGLRIGSEVEDVWQLGKVQSFEVACLEDCMAAADEVLQDFLGVRIGLPILGRVIFFIFRC